MSNAWFENYKRRMSVERAVSPNVVSTASEVSNGEANNVYTRKVSQWKANIASGKRNVKRNLTRKEKAALARANLMKSLAELPEPVEPVYTNVSQWRELAQNNSSSKAQKQADLAAYFAAMKASKPSRNVRHTVGRPKTRKSRKNRKTRRSRK